MFVFRVTGSHGTELQCKVPAGLVSAGNGLFTDTTYFYSATYLPTNGLVCRLVPSKHQDRSAWNLIDQ